MSDQTNNLQTSIFRTSQNRIIDFVDIGTLKEILDSFTTTTSLMADIVDVEGISIFPRSGIKKCCRFCRIIYGLKDGNNRCQSAYKRAGKQAAMFGEPYIFRCPSGLIEWAAPIILNGEHVGTIICGQVLMWKPEEFFWIELREMNKSLTTDFQDLFEAVRELPIISGHQVQAAAYLLYVVANYIMKAGWENYEQIKEFASQQSMYYAEIENRKILEKQLGSSSGGSLVDENEIMVELYKNEKSAKAYLQAVIFGLRYESHNNLSVVRAKMTELLVILLRVTNQMGLEMSKFLDINNNYIGKIYETNSVENLCVLASIAVDAYLERIKETQNKPLNANIKMMIEYIENEYMKNLSLKAISDSVCLSPGYASRMFKDHMGMSINDYVLKVRIQKAKKLLLNPHYQIQTIAENVGFSDSGYFTKVFKTSEGITPTQFRKYHKR